MITIQAHGDDEAHAKGNDMDDETLRHFWALREVNKSLIIGLNAAIFILESEKELIPETRKSLIESLKGLITISEEIYGEEKTKN